MQILHSLSAAGHRLLLTIKKDIGLFIASVFLAIVCWFVISIAIYPTAPKTIEDIPVVIDLTGTLAAENGLSVISPESGSVTVDIVIQGDRSQIGSLTAQDLTAFAEVENVTTTGEKQLAVKISSKSSAAFTVESIEPSTITVVFDQIDTRTFPLSVVMPNVSTAEGMSMDNSAIAIDPPAVSITGSVSKLDLIDHVAVSISETATLDTPYVFHSETLALYDQNGGIIDPSVYTIETVNYSVSVPVHAVKTLDLALDIRYTPSYFSMEFLKSHLLMSEKTLTLSSANAELSELDSWNLGSVVLSDIDLDYSAEFPIEVGAGYTNRSNLDSVTVSLDPKGLSETTVRVSRDHISVINAPVSYDFSIVSSYVDVTLVGDQAQIDQLTEKDVIVAVDLSTLKVNETSFSSEITVTTPNYDCVWAVHPAWIWLEAEEKVTETEESS